MIVIGAVTAAILLAAIVASVFAAGGGSREYNAHMEMAQKYLDELDYEQAVVELRLAIEIKPKDSAAYLTLADVYVTMGDYGNAIAVLEEGYDATGDEELPEERERIAGEYAKVQEQERIEQERQEQERKEQEQKEREQRIEEFYEKYAELYSFVTEEVDVVGRQNIMGSFRFLTYAEWEQACGGLVEQLEQYLADLDGTEGLPEELYDDEWYGLSVEDSVYFTQNAAYEHLAYIYLYMGKLEECLRVRTEWAEFCDRPDLVQDGNHGYDEESDVEYDRYGRITYWLYDDHERIYVYEESHNGVTHLTTTCPWWLGEDDYTYDSEGRILHIHKVTTESSDGSVSVWDADYVYTGNHSYVKTETRTNTAGYIYDSQSEEQFYDEYGW